MEYNHQEVEAKWKKYWDEKDKEERRQKLAEQDS